MNKIELNINYSDLKERSRVAQQFIDKILWEPSNKEIKDFRQDFEEIAGDRNTEDLLFISNVPALLIQSFVYFALKEACLDEKKVTKFIERFCLKGFQMEDACAKE